MVVVVMRVVVRGIITAAVIARSVSPLNESGVIVECDRVLRWRDEGVVTMAMAMR